MRKFFSSNYKVFCLVLTSASPCTIVSTSLLVVSVVGSVVFTSLLAAGVVDSVMSTLLLVAGVVGNIVIFPSVPVL